MNDSALHDSILHIRQLQHSFATTGGQLRRSLCIPELSVRRGELLVVTGPSGSGKSTLLNLIGGFLSPSSGSLLLNGKAIASPGPDRIVVFQDHAIFPWFTALQNTAYGLRGAGMPKAEAHAKALEALRMVGLDSAANLYPAELSGGMRQRVALARALALSPDILLLDEPFASVDEAGRARLRSELLHLWKRFGWTIIMVTHDLPEALMLADRIALLLPPPHGLAHIYDISHARPRNIESPFFQHLHQELFSAMKADSHDAPV